MSEPFDLDAARRMRAKGAAWTAIGKRFGFGGEYVKRRVDPEYAEHRRTSIRESRRIRRQVLGLPPVKAGRPSGIPSPETRRDAERILSTLPPDTRTPIQKLMGDPPPGRSALEQRGPA